MTIIENGSAAFAASFAAPTAGNREINKPTMIRNLTIACIQHLEGGRAKK
jgi:hypothetical protein